MGQNKHVADLTSHSGALPDWEICNDAHANPFLSQTLPALILPALWTLLLQSNIGGFQNLSLWVFRHGGSTATSHPTADPRWDRKCCWNWRWASLRWRAGRIESTSGGISRWMMNIKPWRPSSTYLFYSSRIKPNLQTSTSNRDTISWTYLQPQNFTHKNNQVTQCAKFTMGAVVSCVSSQHPQDLGRSS